MSDYESDADKRAHHNALERKRRNHIKASFNKLKNALPSHLGVKASRTQILQDCIDYIQAERKRCLLLQKEVEDIKKVNKVLEQECRLLEGKIGQGKKNLAMRVSADLPVVETSHLDSMQHAYPAGDCDTSFSSESSLMESSDDEERP